MFCSIEFKHNINNWNERNFRITLNKHLREYSISIHFNNFPTLAIEIYKVKHNLAPEIVSNMFYKREVCYNSRARSEFLLPNLKTVKFGTETYVGPNIYNMPPNTRKYPLLTSLNPILKYGS